MMMMMIIIIIIMMMMLVVVVMMMVHPDVHPSIHQSMNHSINQSIDRLMNQEFTALRHNHSQQQHHHHHWSWSHGHDHNYRHHLSLCHCRFLEESFSWFFWHSRSGPPLWEWYLNILYVSLRSALQVGWLNSVRFPQQPLCIPCTQANRLQTGHSTVQSWCLSSKPPKLKNLDWHFLMHYPGFFSTACCLSLEALFAQSFTQVCGTLGGYPGGDALRCFFDVLFQAASGFLACPCYAALWGVEYVVRDVFGAEISEGWIVHQSSIRSYGVDLSGVCEQIWDQRAIYCELVFGSFLKHRLCEVDKMAAALDVQSSTSPISMFLLAGQSNMAGRGEVPPDFEDDPRIRVIAADGTWKIAKHPLHADKPEKAGVGPGISFAKSIVAGVSVSPANTGQGVFTQNLHNHQTFETPTQAYLFVWLIPRISYQTKLVFCHVRSGEAKFSAGL